MQHILILGAGLSSSTLIKYLLDHSLENEWYVTLGDINEELAMQKIDNHPNGKGLKFDVKDDSQRGALIEAADIVISMLPVRKHYPVAEDCVKNRKPLVTASYVSEEIRGLDAEARKQGVLLLNEMGVDPGIDHMSAMRIIHRTIIIHGAINLPGTRGMLCWPVRRGLGSCTTGNSNISPTTSYFSGTRSSEFLTLVSLRPTPTVIPLPTRKITSCMTCQPCFAGPSAGWDFVMRGMPWYSWVLRMIHTRSNSPEK
jgi:hypothetical protein